MCLAVPGKVISIKDTIAEIDMMGSVVQADISMLPDIRNGDYVIVHAGFAIQRYNEKEALESIALFRQLAENADKE